MNNYPETPYKDSFTHWHSPNNSHVILMSELTIQSQHWREVLAVGDTRGISHTCFPQVGPEGSCGDDRPIHRGHLPVVCWQGGRYQDPSWDSQEKGHNLCCHVAHFSHWLRDLDWDRTEIFPAGVMERRWEGRTTMVRQLTFVLQNVSTLPALPNIYVWEPALFNAHHSLTHNHSW